MITNTKGAGILTKFSYSVKYIKGEKYSATLTPGIFLIECWGASGSHKLTKTGGYGAYVRGHIRILQPTTVYLFPGESGKTYGSITYNGGGDGSFQPEKAHTSAGYQVWLNLKNKAYCGSGGGASDVRLDDGDWDDTMSLKSRIIVAAGGGGYVNFNSGYVDNEVPGSAGGALEAKKGGYSQCKTNCLDSDAGPIVLAEGGSQSRGGKISQSLDGIISHSEGGLGYGGNSTVILGGGGGGGYFGGSGGSQSYHRNGSGAGGSSFISGHKGCHAFTSQYSNETSSSSNIHYSGLYFTDTTMMSGDETFLSPDGRNETGHTGNGYISIKAISLIIQTQSFKTIRIPYSLLFILLIK